MKETIDLTVLSTKTKIQGKPRKNFLEISKKLNRTIKFKTRF